MMSSFPSLEERTVASSLLLLHTRPPSPSVSTPKFHSDDSNDPVPERSSSSKSFRESSVSGSSNKYSSYSHINDHGGSSEEDEIKSRSVSFFSATARYHQMKFKIARKIRSKVMWTSCSGDRKPNAGEEEKVSPVSISGEASSCLSSNSSGISSARSLRYASRAASAIVAGMGLEPPQPPPATPHRAKHTVGSPHLRRRGEAILKLLSLGGSSEVKIRQMLGDSPDTSKALRM
ncbi:putative serine-rich protein C1E8.05 [Sesbania bispinosa]|nr:putative serine-rich protein C1E8.05 [Sesbania bispinosa]